MTATEELRALLDERGVEWVDDDHGRKLGVKVEKLQSENVKLRELVCELFNVMWSCAEERCARRREGCFRVPGNKGPDRSVGSCWYEERMRELGIEVQ